MSIYSPQRKAIYLSPNRLELLHRRRGFPDHENGCMVCAVQSGKVSWQEFADWLSARGFRVEKARPLYITLAAPGISYTRFGWLHSCAELDRLLDVLEAKQNESGCRRSTIGSSDLAGLNVFSSPPRSALRMLSRAARLAVYGVQKTQSPGVDVAPMSNGIDRYPPSRIVDSKQDAIIAHAQSIRILPAQLLDPRRSRHVLKFQQLFGNPILQIGGKRIEFLFG